MDVSFEELLNFKHRRKTELYNLRNEIRKLENTISCVESIEELKQEMEKFKESWQKELVKTEKIFKDGKIKYILGGLRSFVAETTAVGGFITLLKEAGNFAISDTGLKVAVGVAGCLGIGVEARNYKNRIRKNSNNNVFAYVIEANREGLLRDYKDI